MKGTEVIRTVCFRTTLNQKGSKQKVQQTRMMEWRGVGGVRKGRGGSPPPVMGGVSVGVAERTGGEGDRAGEGKTIAVRGIEASSLSVFQVAIPGKLSGINKWQGGVL